MSEVLIRPMRDADVAAAERLSDEAFLELDRRTLPRDWPAPERRTPEHSTTWISRTTLWACLAGAGPEYLVPHVTAANQWAVDVGLTAGLTLGQSGYLAVRGMPPPAPYVHNGALL